jgi:hypothetical protein
MKTALAFAEWKKLVDAAVAKKTGGLTCDDLPDCPYADWHDDGLTPNAAAGKAIKAAKDDGPMGWD